MIVNIEASPLLLLCTTIYYNKTVNEGVSVASRAHSWKLNFRQRPAAVNTLTHHCCPPVPPHCSVDVIQSEVARTRAPLLHPDAASAPQL